MAKQIKLKLYPNISLTTKTKEWDFSRSKEELLSILDKMKDILTFHPEGVAISANQVGISDSIFLIEAETAKKWDIPRVIINPSLKTITEASKIEDVEGCLSFPNIFVRIKRDDLVACDYQDEDGAQKTIILEGFPARIFQHECEHLNGKLFIDHLPRIQKFQVIGAMKNKKG